MFIPLITDTFSCERSLSLDNRRWLLFSYRTREGNTRRGEEAKIARHDRFPNLQANLPLRLLLDRSDSFPCRGPRNICSFQRIHLCKKTQFLQCSSFRDYLYIFLACSLPFTSFFSILYSFALIDSVTLDKFYIVINKDYICYLYLKIFLNLYYSLETPTYLYCKTSCTV